MTVVVRATKILGKDLKEGDLFSTHGPSYWNDHRSRHSIGEAVYIRTAYPAATADDHEEEVYKIEILKVHEYVEGLIELTKQMNPAQVAITFHDGLQERTMTAAQLIDALQDGTVTISNV